MSLPGGGLRIRVGVRARVRVRIRIKGEILHTAKVMVTVGVFDQLDASTQSN